MKNLIKDYQKTYLDLKKAWLVELVGTIDKKERLEIRKTIKEIDERYLKTRNKFFKVSKL